MKILKGHSNMKTYLINNISKFTRRFLLGSLLLCVFAGQAMAQGNDGQFVIKKDGHYLAHIKVGATWKVKDIGAFHPDSCLWYSGTTFNPAGLNHNYYFHDGENYRFLAAPFEPDGTFSLSASTPATSLLRNKDRDYYFYDWDGGGTPYDGGGLARGHQHDVNTEQECTACGGNWQNVGSQQSPRYECWEVYWVEYDDQWKLTTNSHYSRNPEEDNGHGGVPDAGLFWRTTVTEHEMEVTPGTGGLTVISVPTEMQPSNSAQLSATIDDFAYSYIPAYSTFVFEGGTHNYYEGADQGNTVPTSTPDSSTVAEATYEWTISGEGAFYLTFDDGGDLVSSSTEAMPMVYYSRTNTEGRKTAIVTLTVTYSNTGVTQTLSKEVLLDVECQSPGISDVVVTYEDVTILWYSTAEHYRVYWTDTENVWNNFADVFDTTSYSIVGLEYNTRYYYKVTAFCGDEELEATPYDFTTKEEPGLLVYGCVYGGGRMADVGGNTEVAIINCDSIFGVYGGNDIAGTVQGSDGSSITLGVNSGDDYATYGTTNAKIRIGEVYGGGNGFYAYNGTSFVPASSDYTSQVVQPNASVNAMTSPNEVGEVAWTNEEAEAKTLTFPSIAKTAITVANDSVKVDSIFGGAKNAFLTTNSGDGSLITVNGGTAFAVFGGNNYGGTQDYGIHHIVINGTKTETNDDYPSRLGRDFGIGYVFGGGNKVYGSTTNIEIFGGQCDTVFAGGNSADVYRANVTVNCAMGSGSGVTYGDVFSRAINSYSEGTLAVKEYPAYEWDGSTGIYNVRTLFGGNNKATMEAVPILTLTSGSLGTVYGGGNSGDMLASDETSLTIPSTYNNTEQFPIKYGTHVVMDSPTILIDNLYGGCQMSNVDYSTWVEMKNGHVGIVYGGCNVSGDVGSTRIDLDATSPSLEYQAVQGSTNVVATGGTVHRNLFAGSNGFYHCNDGMVYIEGVNYGDDEQNYIGMDIPTHNETHVVVGKDDNVGTAVTVKGNVYAGGNMAPVGFTIAYVQANNELPALVGLSAVRMNGGRVEGDVYGGGNMASIYGNNEVIVSGGTILGALYGGNDRTGSVADMTNRVLPSIYDYASDGKTPLELVDTYISLTGTPNINTVFGGGNGDYAYFSSFDEAASYSGDLEPVVACSEGDEPIQSRTFVDINIAHDGHINTVYGGGDGVTVTGFIKVFLNVNNPNYDGENNHVGTIFGGNNKGDLDDLVPDIILLHGKVGTVYGGCNEGALGHRQNFNIGGTTYNDVGSMVYLRSAYDGDGEGGSDPITPTAKVTEAVYGGCRMNGVTYNTLVLVESGEHPATFFGGSDVSGDIGGLSQVVVTGGSTGTVYGAGNGDYDYSGGVQPPYSTSSRVDMLGGTCNGNVFGGGLAGESGETHVTVDGGSVAGSVFGGGNQAGVKIYAIDSETNTTGNSTIVMNSGFVGTGIYGGCNTKGAIEGDVSIDIMGGTVGSADNTANIHGGGYGLLTTVAGNVLINYGEDTDGTHNENLNLYGDLYGGSAYGSVNTNSSDATTIHIDNGTIAGNVYGGGLGDPDDDSKGWVYGEVHVYVGGENTNGTYYGKASFNNTSIFGGNNTNASPQTDTYVDIYQTAHTTEDTYTYTGNDRTYAIYRVFGGGNVADFAPENADPHSTKKAHVSVHGCENTIEEVFGGSNAANAISTYTIVDGGRFNYIFGGGNGIIAAANVGLFEGEHHTYSQIKGGHVGFCFGGSNRLGNCVGVVQDTETPGNCGELIIDNLFNGGNNADQIGEQELNLDCSDAKTYLSAYGGCRLGTVYGNITVNVTGGTIGKLFGGCQGASDYAADVKRYPTMEEINQNPGNYTQEVIDFMHNNPSLAGTGGNITVNIYGGAVGEVFGGCDINGNVEGKITVNVERTNTLCGFFLGNVYGASNATDYNPLDATMVSPEVNIIKGQVGGEYDFNGNGTIQEEEKYEGNVFGGGNMGDVTANPKVKLGDPENPTTSPVTILGNVYGGGKIGKINGSTNVIIVPTE